MYFINIIASHDMEARVMYMLKLKRLRNAAQSLNTRVRYFFQTEIEYMSLKPMNNFFIIPHKKKKKPVIKANLWTCLIVLTL